MRLSSQASQFVFNLPQGFLPAEIIETYQPILEKNFVPYENVIDYLNSTIIGVNFPGLSIKLPTNRVEVRGKKRYLPPATNIQDIITTNELTVTMRSVDADLNYWVMFDILMKHYMTNEYTFVDPIQISCLDMHRDEIYVITFSEVIFRELSSNDFKYNAQKVAPKEFTLTFHFNFYDIEFMLDKRKVLELKTIPQIVQKL